MTTLEKIYKSNKLYPINDISKEEKKIEKGYKIANKSRDVTFYKYGYEFLRPRTI